MKHEKKFFRKGKKLNQRTNSNVNEVAMIDNNSSVIKLKENI